MPLTCRDDVRDSLMDSVFARGDLSKAMPKYQFPDHESLPNDRQKTERARALGAATYAAAILFSRRPRVS